mmetsp:Transcript_38878/g.89776  ORF Transcript_38878/g.89776 Transcript_38878/m.89776 type:complete len:122 (+) Transcript_38878:2405-2770(+)
MQTRVSSSSPPRAQSATLEPPTDATAAEVGLQAERLDERVAAAATAATAAELVKVAACAPMLLCACTTVADVCAAVRAEAPRSRPRWAGAAVKAVVETKVAALAPRARAAACRVLLEDILL